jgi:RNA polymerase sigma-70 factor (ECF subfamily)
LSDDTSPPDWNAVYEQQIARLYNYFLYRVNQPDTAEDLTASTFKRAWANRQQYDPQRGSVSAWLFGIARYVLVDYYRDRPPPTLSIEDAYRAASPDNTEHTVQKRLEADMLGQLLQQLPQREQDVIALKYGADMTNRAIADLTGLSESNVGTMLHRTVRKLQRLLRQKGKYRYGS